jgi:ferredoxin
MRLVNNAERCNGHLNCCARAPDLLTVDESPDKEWTVSIRGRTIEVPPELEDQAREAEEACPEMAYTLLDADD